MYLVKHDVFGFSCMNQGNTEQMQKGLIFLFVKHEHPFEENASCDERKTDFVRVENGYP